MQYISKRLCNVGSCRRQERTGVVKAWDLQYRRPPHQGIAVNLYGHLFQTAWPEAIDVKRPTRSQLSALPTERSTLPHIPSAAKQSSRCEPEQRDKPCARKCLRTGCSRSTPVTYEKAQASDVISGGISLGNMQVGSSSGQRINRLAPPRGWWAAPTLQTAAGAPNFAFPFGPCLCALRPGR